MPTQTERFLAKCEPIPIAGCWIWMGTIGSTGYGRFCIHYKKWKAHRASWEIYKGQIPAGLFVCHKCDIPTCVNPDHLFLGTPQQNSSDAVKKLRPMGTKIRKLTKENVVEILLSDLPMNQLAKNFGVTISTIVEIIDRKIWKRIHVDESLIKPRNGAIRGELHSCAKLTDNIVKKIRSSHLPTADLAKIYSVNETTINSARSGKTWKHIP